jgi:hypothetical protein
VDSKRWQLVLGCLGAEEPAFSQGALFDFRGTILLIVLILLLIGVIPTWPHSRSWGYAPSGVLGVVVIILIVLLLLGRI